ncbi:porin [Paraburkholderia bannensis]|uniref:porin n=1 Tax=Paraburkholderia bannensis TaxID=765414 RepID=UPI002AAF855A|nr:porin [Paraburkholderia bannensis]
MKKTTAALGAALLAISAQSAFAQSSVTLYGIVDTSIRYLTNANKANDSEVQMGVGPITGSRWGLKGQEDLGGGLSAVFRLENGFNLWNGQLASSNTLFNRMAYVGLQSNQYGALTFGRQNTPLFDQLGNVFDPLTVGNFDQDSWLPGALGYGLRSNNSVKYDGHFGGLEVEAMYAFGGVAGSVGASNMYGVTAAYSFGPFSIDAGYQQNSDLHNNKYRVANVSGVYQIGPVKAMAGWLYGQDNTGIVDLYMGASGSPAANFAAPVTNTNRIDNGLYAGAVWQVTAPLTLTAAYYYDHASNALNSDGATLSTGIRYSAVLLAEYSLSKRTEVYGTVDFTRGTGAATADFPGRNNQTGVAVGLRNIF